MMRLVLFNPQLTVSAFIDKLFDSQQCVYWEAWQCKVIDRTVFVYHFSPKSDKQIQTINSRPGHPYTHWFNIAHARAYWAEVAGGSEERFSASATPREQPGTGWKTPLRTSTLCLSPRREHLEPAPPPPHTHMHGDADTHTHTPSSFFPARWSRFVVTAAGAFASHSP